MELGIFICTPLPALTGDQSAEDGSSLLFGRSFFTRNQRWERSTINNLTGLHSTATANCIQLLHGYFSVALKRPTRSNGVEDNGNPPKD